MSIDAIAAAQGNAATQQKSSTTVDYQSFLRLLVTQMKNQDPTKPMDSTDYVAQLATFSQVEQTVQTNTKLDQLLQFSLLGQASSIIGRTATSVDGEISGKVKQAMITDTGVVAVLEDGSMLEIGPGVTLS